MKSSFSESSAVASEPSGSSNANEREETEPAVYEEGVLTHEGRWVMVRVV